MVAVESGQALVNLETAKWLTSLEEVLCTWKTNRYINSGNVPVYVLNCNPEKCKQNEISRKQ